ncbi:hypothetical protein JCM11491_005798 [Sporobolomyces phaffii]
MSFTPRLSSTTFVPFSLPSSRPASSAPSPTPRATTTKTLYFTYSSTSDSTSPVTCEPQVWTNLGSASDSSDSAARAWHAVPFLRSPEPALAGLLVASVQVSLDTLARDGPTEFEYTYRFRHVDDQRNERIEWVGSQGGNGRVVFVDETTIEERGIPDSDPASKDAGEGSWSRERDENGADVHVARYETKDGEDCSFFNLTNEVRAWIGPAEAIQVDGLTLEQSSRTWFTPRILPTGPSPLSHVSHAFVSQLLLVRTQPCLEHPFERLLVVFPFSSTQSNSSLIGRGHDELFVRCEKDQDHAMSNSVDHERDERSGVVLVSGSLANNDTFDSVIARAVSAARLALDPSTATRASPAREEGIERDLRDVTLCTWNALGPDYTVSSLLSWLDAILDPSNTTCELSESFKRGGVMLDDGWQDTEIFIGTDGDELRGLRGFGTRKGWYDLENDVEEGGSEKKVGWELGEAVKKIKERGVERVGVWITITGYWNCLHPSFADETSFDLTRATFSSRQHDNFHFTSLVPTLDSLGMFFSTYFARMKEDAGVDFIKIDNQALVDSVVSLEDSTPPGLYRAELLSVVQRESARVFGASNVVHCMAHSTRIWSGLLALSSFASSPTRPALRNSDDYFPNEPDSHRWHVYINAVNLALTRHVHRALDPDLDMGQEQHEWGAFHLALKGFSTSGVWATDSAAARNDGGRLGDRTGGWQGLLATSLARTKVVQARGGQSGSILSNQVLSKGITSREGGEHGGEALKVGLRCRRAQGGTIGMWNCQENGSVKARVFVRDVLDVLDQDPSEPEEDLVVFIDESFGPTPSSSPDLGRPVVATIDRDRLTESRSNSLSLPVAELELPPRAVQITRFAELCRLAGGGKEDVTVACLGLRDKFVGLEAIKSVEIVEAHAAVDKKAVRVDSDDAGRPLQAPNKCRTPASAPLVAKDRDFPSPPPGTFLSAYLANFCARVWHPSSPSSPPSKPFAYQPSPVSSLLQSFWKRPVSTVLNEVRGILTFGFAVIAWSFRNRQSRALGTATELEDPEHGAGGRDGATGRDTANEPEKSNRNLVVDRSPARASLRIELEFVSSHLVFYCSPGLSSSVRRLAPHERLEFKLDGRVIDAEWITTIGEDRLVRVDVEGFWEANGQRKRLGAKVWVVEVCSAL